MNDEEEISNCLVPGQYVGGHTGVIEVTELQDKKKASKLFAEAKQRLQNINNWENMCEGLSAEFCLTDSNGIKTHDLPRIGFLIRINLPAPALDSGKGYDRVRIEHIEQSGTEDSEEEIYTFRVRPSSNPFSQSSKISHLYKNNATSSFILYRKHRKVFALQEGRNEIPNTEVNSLTDKIRNTIVAFSALLGFSTPQWKKLVRAILGLK